MFRQSQIALAALGCILMGFAGLLKTIDGEPVVGLLLIGFAVSAFGNSYFIHHYGPLIQRLDKRATAPPDTSDTR